MGINILLFGGTTEGRKLMEYLCDTNTNIDICVATEYGQKLLQKKDNINILEGRKNLQQMIQLMKQKNYQCVIDATHPYALEVTKNIQQACQSENITYYRLLRESCHTEYGIWVESIEKAVDFLQNTQGNIFVTTGSKELQKYKELHNFSERIYVRVLPSAEVITQCQNDGLSAKHIICMQGAFSKEMNVAQMKHINAKYIVTKESGNVGGFQQKIDAAKEVGAVVVIIGRREKQKGYLYYDLIEQLKKEYHISVKRQVTLLGIGAGRNTLTQQAQQVLKKADCIIGAKRMIETIGDTEKNTFICYKSDEIAYFIKQNTNYNNIVVVFSGDIGYYSGAKKLYDLLENVTIKTISGVPSICYFMAKLHTDWEDAKLISTHGQYQNIIGYVLQYHKTIVLLGSAHDAANICKEICNRALTNVKVVIGENLSYETEKITEGTAEQFQNIETSLLAILYIENNNTLQKIQNIGIKDECFIRDAVPMTKREVRTIAISYMDLKQNDIVWDIGAGTGSVSIEIALQCPFGMVYAIEKKQQAITLLEKNKKKWNVYNMNIISGQAPDVLQTLPAPNKIFIGGSSGTAMQSIKIALQKNPSVEIVATAITLETIRDLEQCFSELGIEYQCTQMSVSKSETVKNYHIMKAQNTVFIFCGRRTPI
ncbi:bifunctional cobalt-precorrin-7 (C(5))-methyltransferase/cobalt-precorrin-6B (C(15))-methyltransferase [Clostridium sp. MD294]|uniref:precorrin-6A reductase n=1 Tax=Clostridium sp. MD294 TaxID=97138 RepID=UPI0002CC31F7|nr:bifunctional cobalt-precorrin-7 (C(5))-methyltransferase/cobalt-precorrin-6B (C(15))-methyltransferase [Clostridium sp. MD294]NDO45572.1 bifunctional cobalt-precorrin-7 (C(5))-methyltransferase/cobalt-precorrin-6B (C(15))-methyltransferase [Clostridium sp. MD294]USF30774.1 hypothetical protein C820_002217 [Clostridium sp. MD294]